MRNEQIKKCECGSDDFQIVNPMSALYQVFCLKCGKSAPMGYTENNAIEQWNKQEGSNA
jgi:translation initiation factor 2 beta subunit (eIF-2beta)/eIF-5